MSAADDKRWINLEKVVVLALEQSVYGQKILGQMLRGLGIRNIRGARGSDEAFELTGGTLYDLLILDPGFDDGRGLDFVRKLRRADSNANRFVPIILTTGHSTTSTVTLSRDTGTNFVVAKPFTPKALLERILWVARDARPYVDAGQYVGPDRRMREGEPPKGMAGRRARDKALAETQTEGGGDNATSNEQKVA